MKYFMILATLLVSFGAQALSKQNTQEFYEQMSKHSLCAAAATYTNNDSASNEITNYMYEKLDFYANGEYLSNTKRGFMVGYSVGMSQAVFGQLYKQQGEPKGIAIKDFAKMVWGKMCTNLEL
ncbi:hypothetical protein BOO92_22080 [Vibrio navarrensis]|uniref:hypothetical protein n=1 Tax=Vibrio navarrensis TaxID=29495 RepID=UPI0018664C7B|nr:hypothetical protein [Vibrio navarrensis]MBE3659316.1 hypothetical protein [Vibrio navarrensis]